MFKSAITKLTLIYLLIIMSISIFFSISVYRVSAVELNKNLRRQENNFQRFGRMQEFTQDPFFIEERENLLREGKKNLELSLFYTNIVILILGGAISYFLAKRTLEPIEEAHESQKRFTADASHELRSPLAVMKTEIEVALREKKLSNTEMKNLLKSNLEEIEKLKKLTEGLLELSRDNGQGIILENESIYEIISHVIKENHQKLEKKRLELLVDVDEKISVFINKDNISELFNILLDNAIKYTDPEKRITITAKRINNKVQISFADQGIGIDKKDLPFVFDRFFRADLSRTKNKIDGYGLGLSIAKKIVEVNKGKIEVQSDLKIGSKFVVTLPASEN